MLFTPDLETGFRKVALLVTFGHALLFVSVWLVSSVETSTPRPITVRLYSDAQERLKQGHLRLLPQIARSAALGKEPSVPAASIPVPVAVKPSVVMAPLAMEATPPAVAVNPSVTSSAILSKPAAQPEAAPAKSNAPESTTTGTGSAAPASSATNGGAEDRQPMVDASFRGNRVPEYPAMSRRLGEQGVVVVRVLITPDGQASEVLLVKSSGSSRLDRSAMDTIRVWRFVPALRAGRPVAAWYEWRWEFRLSG